MGVSVVGVASSMSGHFPFLASHIHYSNFCIVGDHKVCILCCGLGGSVVLGFCMMLLVCGTNSVV